MNDDHTLIARIRDGDSVAFESLVRRYFEGLYRFAYQYLHRREAAEEVLQETFWWVWEHRAQLAVRESVQSYLYRAVRNRITDVVRHARVENAYAEQVGAEGGIATTADPMEQYEAQEFADALELAVARLPVRTREAYVLYHQQGLRYAEVAEVMQISVKGVEFHLGKALRSLRRELQRFAP